MTALLVVRRGGDITGICDARCYDAEQPECRCICEGVNHRAGLAQAVANTRQMHAEWIGRARAKGWQFDRYEVGLPITQDVLFPPAVLLEEPPPAPGPLEFRRDRPLPAWPADLTATEEPLF